jgi:4'-phosphopantetheinyl transferase
MTGLEWSGASRLWLIDLDREADRARRLRPALPACDHERAESYSSAVDRERFLVGRTIVRVLLAALAGVRPDRLRLTSGRHGKPEIIPSGPTSPPLHFSVSKSAGRLLVAVDATAPVGVDIECVRPDFDMDRIAVRYFSSSEQRDLRRIPAGERTRCAYICWTRKEAYLKGLGVGLTLGLDGFSVSVNPTGPVTISGSLPSAETLSGWSLVPVDVDRSAVAALAVARSGENCPRAITPNALTYPYEP